jgi:DEAD/DEAH box helicase domain-containing protein
MPHPVKACSFPDRMSLKIVNILDKIGINAPYSHQIAAWEALEDNRNIVVATPTASGKTLCYNIPVINRLLDNPESRALYLFPTKALSRDQEQAIQSLACSLGIEERVWVYDGDTPSNERQGIREKARILITNPDMLHMGILPHHTSWSAFFSGLKYVIIDELHIYRGVFGSHVANLIRRFNRITAFYNASPVFAACSATISNPRELAQTLVGKPFELIVHSGAPQRPRTFVVYNPAVVNRDTGGRRSALGEAVRLASDLIASGLTVLVFCQSRRQVEIALRYLRDKLRETGSNPTRVRGYRGGYLPTLRREIESAFKNGELDAVVATNALELGIDIGSLDAVVMAGYPGTIAALRQRAGRAGRTTAPSLSVMVATSNPLDQFLAREPRYLVDATPEQALVQPDNVEVMLSHLKCSVFELPFDASESFGNLSVADTEAALSCLVDEGNVSVSKGRHYYLGESYPAGEMSLRNISADRVTVIDQQSGEAMAEVDFHRAKKELYQQAIYLSEGQAYYVDNLDLESKRALVSEVEPSYYTQAMCDTNVRIVEKLGGRSLENGEIATGEVVVKEAVTGFKKIKFHTHENLGYGQVSLPPSEMETEAFWITPLIGALCAGEECAVAEIVQGFSGLGHALQQAASLRLMCDPKDLAFVMQNATTEMAPDADQTPSLFFFDTHPGGVGLSARAFEEITTILSDVSRLIQGCGCARGCPSCVGPIEDKSGAAKTLALAIANGLSEASSGEFK